MTRIVRLHFVACLLLMPYEGYAVETGSPRLLGMNIGEKHYGGSSYQKQLARLDIVVLGSYRGWGGRPEAMREVVLRLKKMKPNIRIGQYGVLNELRDVAEDTALADSRSKVSNFGWWLRNRQGQRVQWTHHYTAWEINFTAFAPPDTDGKRYPQWLEERDFRAYHQPAPEFDFWYADNVMRRPRVTADWDGDGIDDDPGSPRILEAWRQGYAAWWSRIRELTSNKWITGNADGDLSESGFRHQLESVFLKVLMGKPWSIESRQGWATMMARYRAVKANLREPRIVGFNVWGDPKDYRFFRYAFTSCLLDDGYFSFTDDARGYSSVPWFDEYDVKLGKAITQPPARPWRKGVWRRDFERGIVLVNPAPTLREVVLEPGLRRIRGQQDPAWNDGQPAHNLILSGRDGIILIREEKS